MNRLKKYLQSHPNLVKYFVLGYIAFIGCFTFPLWSENSPLEFMKVYLIVYGYGILALGLSCVYGAEKAKKVYALTLLLTSVGLLCRYFLEFGEDSNTYNFTPFNIALYLLVVPACTIIAYHLMAKHLMKHRP